MSAKIQNQKNVDTLMTTRWEQEHPYNYQLKHEGQDIASAPVGCVGVAGGQIMAFHRHPLRGKGIIYQPTANFELDIEGYEYDWDGMKDRLAYNSDQRNIDAVSNILHHCHITANTSGASGHPDKMFAAFVNNFGYDKHIGFIDLGGPGKNYIAYDEVQSLIRDELDAGRPVQVSIPGHAVVCDGYREDGFFSFNYGWGERARWYTFDNSNNGCNPVTVYLNIRPECKKNITVVDIELDRDTLNPGQLANATIKLKNLSDKNVRGEIKPCLVDFNKIRRNYVSSPIFVEIEGNDTASLNISLPVPGDVSFGDRSLAILFTNEEGGDTVYVDNDKGDMLLCNIKVDRVISSELYLNDAKVPLSVTEGEEFEIYMTINSEVDKTCFLKLLLVDNYTNAYQCVGEKTIEVNIGHNELIFDADFTDVNPQSNHALVVVEGSEGESISSYKMIASGEVINKFDIYVKNKYLTYTSDFTLNTNLDTSNKFYADSRYPQEFVIEFHREISSSQYFIFYLIVSDQDNNIISKSSQGIIIDSGDNKVVLFSPLLNLPKLKSDESEITKEFYVQVAVDDGPDYSLNVLTPKDLTVNNPASLVAHYRNNYDFMFLSKSIEVKNKEFLIGDEFALPISWLMVGENYKFNGDEIVTAIVYLQDDDGVKIEIGRERYLINRYIEREFVIDCKIVDALERRKYNLFVMVCEAMSENGPARERILGITDDVISILEVEIK